jgi:radical SAM superfamily enzyme YgiQ (UPF0313 family)
VTLHVAMIVPPIMDLNTLYASAPRLAGWLRKLGHEVTQLDLSLELCLRMFSQTGLKRLFAAVKPERITLDIEDTYHNRDRYIRIIDDVMAFAQGHDLSTMHRIARGDFIPEGPRFRREGASLRRAAFGEWGRGDLARHLVALMLLDLSDLFRSTIAPHYNLTNYGESLADSRSSFDEIEAELCRPPNEIERMMLEVAADTIPENIDLACLTCPFPGNLLGALFLGRWIRQNRPRACRALGGGYPSTELRQIKDPRIFEYIDYLVLDDGEVPLEQICARLEGKPDEPLVRTFANEGGTVVYHEGSGCKTPRFRELPAPNYEGVKFDRYLHVVYRRNRVSRLLSEGSWLKLTAAHGCYWKKCTFCDIHLSYIGDFDPLPAAGLADQMDAMHAQSGLSGFHFTDEAAPPPLLVKLAVELLRRGRSYQFWGNIRFDPGFTEDRCRALAAAGMIAVTGGIEIASDDLLPKIAKGITVKQVITVLKAFTQAGIMTHAYLIYGFPGETPQDTINSLEILRQLMRAGLLQSAFYHKFSATAHSPIGRKPELFGIRVKGPEFRGFAHYTLDYDQVEPNPMYEERYNALQVAIDTFARGEGLDRDVSIWVRGLDLPETTVDPNLVTEVLKLKPPEPKSDSQMIWLGGTPEWRRGMLSVANDRGHIITRPAPKWLANNLLRCTPSTWGDSWPPTPANFERNDWVAEFRQHGLAIL